MRVVWVGMQGVSEGSAVATPPLPHNQVRRPSPTLPFDILPTGPPWKPQQQHILSNPQPTALSLPVAPHPRASSPLRCHTCPPPPLRPEQRKRGRAGAGRQRGLAGRWGRTTQTAATPSLPPAASRVLRMLERHLQKLRPAPSQLLLLVLKLLTQHLRPPSTFWPNCSFAHSPVSPAAPSCP